MAVDDGKSMEKLRKDQLVTIRLPTDLRKEILDLARPEGRSEGEQMRIMLWDQLKGLAPDTRPNA